MGLALKWIALRLSHHIIGRWGLVIHKSNSSEGIHTSSIASRVRHMYSASILDLGIMDGFFYPKRLNYY